LWELLRESGVAVDPVSGEGSRDEMDRVFDALAKAPEQSFAEFIARLDASDYATQAATGICRRLPCGLQRTRQRGVAEPGERDSPMRLRDSYAVSVNMAARGFR